MTGNRLRRPGLVSVIMNCRNGATWLREAIDSVVAQTYDRWEIIFWDNGSTDDSGAIARSYGPRVRYFHRTETVPLGAARRLALEMADGEFIAFLDCDDVWRADKLEKQIAAMGQGEPALCYGSITEIDARGEHLRVLRAREGRGDRFNALLLQFDVFLPTAMLRGAVLDETGLTFDPEIVASEEYCLFMQISATHEIVALRDILAYYRVHERSLTNASIARWAAEREYTLRQIEARHPGIRERYRSGFREAYARAAYYRARLHVAKRERWQAVRALTPAVLVHPRYAALWALLLLPLGAWEHVHRAVTGRRSFSTQ